MKRILTLSIISLMTASLYAGVYFKVHQTNASAEILFWFAIAQGRMLTTNMNAVV